MPISERDTPLRDLKLVGVAGLGLLGRGIAGCLLAHGFRVIGYDVSPARFASARIALAQAIGELADRGLCEPELVQNWHHAYTEADSVAGMAQCDFVIESIVESVEAKATLFDELEAVLRPDVPVASNTSALPISLLQRERLHPGRFLGMHWADPAHATRFLELIRGELTQDAAIASATRLAQRLGKEPCVVQKDLPGFIANRIGYAMYREACNLLNLGVADAATIDLAFRNSVGLWASVCGPFRWIDLTGGPALYAAAMRGVLPELSNATEIPEPLLAMMQEGASGITSGQGFFDYTPAQAQAWAEIYRKQVWRVRQAVDEAFPLDAEASAP